MRRLIVFAAVAAVMACGPLDDGDAWNPQSGQSGENVIEDYTPEIDATIGEYDGTLADDVSSDVPGDDTSIYWEACGFTKTVAVTYVGDEAEVVCDDQSVICHVSGADVTVDMETYGVEGVEIILKGSSEDGQLKLYASSAVKLTLDGISLTSGKSAAVNSQSKNPLFIHLTEDSKNFLCDAQERSDEAYYPDGVTSDDEKRNGCIYSKGSVVLSGAGLLELKGMKKHGLSVKSSLYMRPGVTMAIHDVADNCIKAEGVTVDGGYLWAKTSADAGKCISSDADVALNAGIVRLYTTGGSVYEEDENDTSSPAGIKADGNMYIRGGDILCVSSGEGGKGINVDGEIVMDGGLVYVATSGGKYVYDASLDLDSSPKGVKADGSITINGGNLNIQVTGISDGSEGLESKSLITINDGDVFVYSYDDAINVGGDSPEGMVINGGRIFAFADNNDGIDSNGKLTVNGGLVIASGCAVPEEGFDCDNSQNFMVTGGVLIGTGGAALSASGSSTQRSVVYNGIPSSTGELFVITDPEGEPILIYEMPRTMSSMSLFFSSPDIEADKTYAVYSGGSLSGNTSNWNGWFADGSYEAGSELGTFTLNSVSVTVGQGGGPGGGPGNGGPGNGGWGPGWWE